MFTLGIGLNAVVLILSIFTVFPDVAANATVKNTLCIIIIVTQLLSILSGNLYQKQVDKDTLGKTVSRTKLIKSLSPYRHDSVLGAREEMRQGLIALTTVFVICSIYWAFMTGDALKFIVVVCIVAIAFIYADYLTHNSFYTKKYDEKLKSSDDSPNSIRGLARIYRHEYNCLGFKRFLNRESYRKLSEYNPPKPGLQDKCIKCILFSKVDAIKNPEIYYGAVIMFFNIFLVIPNFADKAIENILPFGIDTTEKALPYILVGVNVIFTVINIVAMACYEKKSKLIDAVAKAFAAKENGIEPRCNLYQDLQKERDFNLIRARGIFMFNSLAIDRGEDLDIFFEEEATPEDKNEEPFVDDDGNTYTGYLKYRMLYVHRFTTNFQRFFHTVILSYIALLCLLLDLKIELMTIGIIFAIVTVAVLIFGIFILPNIGRWRISKYCKQFNKDNK